MEEAQIQFPAVSAFPALPAFFLEAPLGEEPVG